MINKYLSKFKYSSFVNKLGGQGGPALHPEIQYVSRVTD